MKKLIRYCILILSFAFFLNGYLLELYNVMLVGVLLMSAHNFIYGFENFHKRILFVFFNFSFFIFLIGRPFIRLLQGKEWVNFEKPAMYFALGSIFISLIVFFAGGVFAESMISSKKSKPIEAYKTDKDYIDKIKRFALFLFYIAAAAFIISEISKIIYMSGRDYVEYYLTYENTLPLPIRALGSLMNPALCIFLAAMPKKRTTVIPFIIFIISSVPMLIIGQRNPIVLNIMFILAYYFIRDISIIKKGLQFKKWVGKREKIAIIILLPLVIIGLGVYNYTREGQEMANTSPISVVSDFIDKQGVSFDVLSRGYNAIPDLPDEGIKCYTFGDLIDYYTRGSIGRMVFGTEDLGKGNNALRAIYGNNFSHSMSYAARGQEYLEGHGWGSSYILETYADFGWAGVIVFNFLLGMLLIYLIKFIKSGWLISSISLYALTSIFFMPRAEATGFLSFLYTHYFWMAVIFCLFAAKLCVKKYSFENLKKGSIALQGRKFEI